MSFDSGRKLEYLVGAHVNTGENMQTPHRKHCTTALPNLKIYTGKLPAGLFFYFLQ